MKHTAAPPKNTAERTQAATKRNASMCEQEQIEVAVLIVGFGFSCVPLLRQLERTGQDYTIISKGKTIWQQLKEKDRLDFDLVSSYHASVYTEDQVAEGFLEDYFQTAKENYDYHERIFKPFKEKVIEDRVTLVENHEDYSIVHTENRIIYKAANLVLSTGLGRPQNQVIKEFDPNTSKNKTVVIDIIGDTTNMWLSKLVPNGNRIILLNDGFYVLDKYATFSIPGPKDCNICIPFSGVRLGKKYRLDLAQAECHMVERLFPNFYKIWFNIPSGPPGPENWFAKMFMPNSFHIKFPETWRREQANINHAGRAGSSNGMVGIKYYPIDMYYERFGKELDESIKKGYLLNDIVFWHTEGLVETWSKTATTVDEENRTIVSKDGKLVKFDQFIKGGASEKPNLPPIVRVYKDGTRHSFNYRYRDNYLGVVPQRLNNVFFIGFTRPFTGGIANVTEMQGLMVHKLVSNPKFKASMYEKIGVLIQEYNEYYYAGQMHKDSPTDHVVAFGLYTHDVARFLGINRTLTSALSWNPHTLFNNLRFELLSPHNASKWRLTGEYKIDGADEYIHKVFAFNEHNAIIMFFQLAMFSDLLLGYQCIAMIFCRYGLGCLVQEIRLFQDVSQTAIVAAVSTGILCSLLAHVWFKNQNLIFLQTYSLPGPLFGVKAVVQPCLMLQIARTGEWLWCPLLFLAIGAIAFLSRLVHVPPFSGRYMFGDCKFKHKYRGFWAEYKSVYNKVKSQEAL